MREKFEVGSNSNVLFVTNRCNNHCIMCCQPPRDTDDFEQNFFRNFQLIKAAPKEIESVCITGGEPTLARDKFIELIRLVCQELPKADIQILSNGRIFLDYDFTHELKVVGGDKIFVGIPLHSDYSGDHDLIAGAKHAFSETILGMYNLANEGIAIELRVVINKLNYMRLPNIAEFVFKNLSFISWTAFVGMEDTGLAVRNAAQVWVEPLDYAPYLCRAVDILDGWGMEVAIYNIPLCLLPTSHHRFAAQSISDWKTKYLGVCDDCTVKSKCSGLFRTSKKEFKGIKPI